MFFVYISYYISDRFASFLYAAMIWVSQSTVIMHIETWNLLGCDRYIIGL